MDTLFFEPWILLFESGEHFTDLKIVQLLRSSPFPSTSYSNEFVFQESSSRRNACTQSVSQESLSVLPSDRDAL
jgi:hypothetical protein